MMRIEKVVRWYRSGESFAEAVELLKSEGLDVSNFQHPNPQKFILLKNKLFASAGCNEFDLKTWNGSIDIEPDQPQTVTTEVEPEVELRPTQNAHIASRVRCQLYPKINFETAPDEIKVLIADQFTAYYNYVDAHARLFEIADGEEKRQLCETIILNVRRNRECIDRLQFFNDHGILKENRGKKPSKTKAILEGGNLLEIARLRENSLEAIAKTELEIKKNNKPDLQESRKLSIMKKQIIVKRCEELLLNDI